MKMKKMFALLLALVCVFSLCACGSNAAKTEEYSYTEAAMADYAVPAPAEAPALMAEEALGGFSASNGFAQKSESGSGADTGAPENNPEKLIYSAQVNLETTQFDDTIAALEKLIAQYGAYIQSSSESSNDSWSISRGEPSIRNANYEIRVPAEKFSGIMSSLSTLGNIPYSYTYTENISAQYYDTQARMENYLAQEKRLNELLEKAENVTEVIEIERELTEVRYKIESLQGTLKNWDRQVSYSTINLNVSEVVEYTPSESRSFGQKLADAFKNGWKVFLDFLLVLAEALPVILFIILIAVAIVVIAVKARKKRKAKAAEKADEEKKEKEE